MPEISLNGAAKQIINNFTIAALIEDLDLTTKRLAVEVNMEIVPRSQFAEYILTDGDKVEIIHAVGGG